MKYGYSIDKKLDDQCYGNRIRKVLLENPDRGPSPYLYYPYFNKYESWRDEAINVVEKLLDLKLNALMVSLDIEGYFYNCRVNFGRLKKAFRKSNLDSQNNPVSSNEFDFLNNFVEQVFKKYDSFFEFNDSKIENSKRNPLIPIGFLPSYVISNWYLDEFDKKVRREINPAYYGRYVDDILMVFSLNDINFEKIKNQKFLKNLLKELFKDVIIPDNNKDENIFKINSDCLRGESHSLRIKNQKVKLFFFSHMHSRELIKTFKDNIVKNSSAFFYLQESDDIFSEDYYSRIWAIDYSDTINKIRKY
jgi:Reverse transcriptase (RNA-dependent DNA polymerase).